MGRLSVDGRKYLSNFPIQSGSHPMIRCSDAGVPMEIMVGATKDKLDTPDEDSQREPAATRRREPSQ